jgi:hypothetical protein
MKHFLLFTGLLLLSSFIAEVKAQQAATASQAADSYAYAQIVGMQKFLSTKVTIQVDFGQSRGFFSDTRLRDENTGKVQSFNSMIDALNYMAVDGWDFVQAYVVAGQNQKAHHYLMRKKREE